jgi:hypothetical protein
LRAVLLVKFAENFRLCFLSQGGSLVALGIAPNATLRSSLTTGHGLAVAYEAWLGSIASFLVKESQVTRTTLSSQIARLDPKLPRYACFGK